MKKSAKIKLLGGLVLVGGAFALSSCTASFCSNSDLAGLGYAYEQGVTVYCDADEIPEEYRGEGLSWKVYDDNDSLYAYIPVNADGTYAAKKAQYLDSNVLASAASSHYVAPTYEFWKALDQKVLDEAIATANENGYNYSTSTITRRPCSRSCTPTTRRLWTASAPLPPTAERTAKSRRN